MLEPELRNLLLEQRTLDAWAPYSLDERCDIIKTVFNVKISRQLLGIFYKDHNVKLMSTKTNMDRLLKTRPELEGERVKFAETLATIIAANKRILYLDESTCNSQMLVKKAWS